MIDPWLAAVFLALPILWVGFFFVVSRFGGWSELARVYPNRSSIQGKSWSMRWGKIGGAIYAGDLKMTANSEGLRISTFVSHPWHPPLFIPWVDVSTSWKKRWFGRALSLRMAKAPSVRILISEVTAEAIAGYVGDAWPKPIA